MIQKFYRSFRVYSDSFYESVSSRASATAVEVASEVSRFVAIKSIIDIGSGEGVWSKAFIDVNPELESILAIDLDSTRITKLANSAVGPKLECLSVDLNQDELPKGTYDLGICVEVLEHLEYEAAIKLVDYLSETCKVIVFSAGLRGQGGSGHINEQTFDYWTNLLRDRNFFSVDLFRGKLCDRNKFPTYYSNSIALWVNVKLDGISLIDSKSILLHGNLPLWDIRSCKTKIRFGLLAILPSSFVTFLSLVYRKVRIRP
jgi:hypothetical protein